MATTSLAAQLQKLAIPQATVFKDDKKRASLLFTPHEAALKDRETFYRIGLTGLAELGALYEGFRVYEDTLFSDSSKDFERSIQTKAVNISLDENIEKFLLQLSPYLLLTPAHQALEWLINRYHIHEYNQDALLALILPYHSTLIFVRIFQLMKLNNTKWSGFPHQVAIRKGNPLSCEALYSACVINKELIPFISKSTIKYVELYGERANQLSTVIAFFCQTAIATIRAKKKTAMEVVLTSLLPVIVKAIDSPIIDFRASGYIVLGLLLTKITIKIEILSDIVSRLLTTQFDLTYDVTLLLTILYEQQKHYTSMSDTLLNDLSTEVMFTLCSHLKVITQKNNSIYRFVCAILRGVLPKIQKDGEEFMRYSKLAEIMVDELDFKNQQPEVIIG